MPALLRSKTEDKHEAVEENPKRSTGPRQVLEHRHEEWVTPSACVAGARPSGRRGFAGARGLRAGLVRGSAAGGRLTL